MFDLFKSKKDASEPFRKDASELFPDDSYSRAIELIKKFVRLVPPNEDKIIYLDTFITYVDGIINGDDISKYNTKERLSVFAMEAFKEIIDGVHENIMDSYKLEKTVLEEEIASLQNNKNILDRQIQDLQESKTNLEREADSLNVELLNLRKELEDLKSKVDEEIEEERKRLNDEVQALSKTKEELSKAINDYNLTISKLSEISESEESKDVVWQTLNKNEPVFNILLDATNYNIYDFIKSLKEEYMNNTGTDKIHCDKDFEENSPSLMLIPKLMKQILSADYVNIRYILNYRFSSSDDKYNVIRLKRAINELKIPVYLKNSNKKDESISPSTIPTEISSINRELYFQRMAMKAITEKRIIEFQFRNLLDSISSTLPEEYVKELLKTYTDSTSSYTPEIQEPSDSLKLEL